MSDRKDLTPFGKAIKIELIQQGITGKALAKRMGVAESTVCDVIAGRNKCERTRRQVMDILGVEIPFD